MCTHHNLFACSSTGGHLGCFYLLAVVNNAAMSFVSKGLFEYLFLILLVRYLGVELLGRVVVAFNVLRNCQTVFSQWLHHFTFPPAVYEGAGWATSSSTLVIVRFIDNSHSNGCDVVSHCGFDLGFLMMSDA